MASANVTFQIEGLDDLRALVERLAELMAEVDRMGRPLFGDVHISSPEVTP